MKEIDIIKHAKSYMDMLSKGINPITKELYPDNSDLKNERLIKCFEFVSTILERVVKEEEEKESSQPKEPSQPSAVITNSEPTFPPNSLVSDDIVGQEVIDTLIKKGLLKQGMSDKNQ